MTSSRWCDVTGGVCDVTSGAGGQTRSDDDGGSGYPSGIDDGGPRYPSGVSRTGGCRLRHLGYTRFEEVPSFVIQGKAVLAVGKAVKNGVTEPSGPDGRRPSGPEGYVAPGSK